MINGSEFCHACLTAAELASVVISELALVNRNHTRAALAQELQRRRRRVVLKEKTAGRREAMVGFQREREGNGASPKMHQTITQAPSSICTLFA